MADVVVQHLASVQLWCATFVVWHCGFLVHVAVPRFERPCETLSSFAMVLFA